MKIIKNLAFGALAALAVTLLFQTSITRAGDHDQRGDHGQRDGDNERGDRDHRDDDNKKGDRDHRVATVTWTKHVTAFLPPGGEIFATIAGVAGGDLGAGTVIGEAFSPVVVLLDGSVTFEADYHFVGSKHSLTVHFRTIQAPDNSGVVIGVVTDGWLKGNVVEGEYTGYACDKGVAGVCFDGTFRIKKGSKDKDCNDRD